MEKPSAKERSYKIGDIGIVGRMRRAIGKITTSVRDISSHNVPLDMRTVNKQEDCPPYNGPRVPHR